MIYLMRHGTDDNNYVGGWSDVDLTESGILEVNNLANKMLNNNIKISRIISSDIKRAKTTANIINSYYKCNNIHESNIFREQNKGILNGMKLDIAKKNYPTYFNSVNIDTIYPNGESLNDLYKRIKDNLEYILSLEDNTLIVTHRGVINMLYYILNDKNLDMDKKQFKVTHASLHELDPINKTIRRVF
jgi:probable phosphoglycerate mutase